MTVSDWPYTLYPSISLSLHRNSPWWLAGLASLILVIPLLLHIARS